MFLVLFALGKLVKSNNKKLMSKIQSYYWLPILYYFPKISGEMIGYQTDARIYKGRIDGDSYYTL